VPQDRPESGSASDWLARARGDLTIAKAPLTDHLKVANYSVLSSGIIKKSLLSICGVFLDAINPLQDLSQIYLTHFLHERPNTL
jgi:hypothetical protein